MSLPWNTGVKLCPNKEYGCSKKYLSDEELEEHILSCQYRGVDIKLLIKTVHGLEDKIERIEGLGVPSLMRRLEVLESKSRGEGHRRQDSSLELRDIRDRLVEIEAASQAVRDDTRVSSLARQLEQLEQRLPEASDREELDSKYRELKISYHKLLNDVSQLRDTVNTGAGRRRLESGASADESVQTQIAELRKKQRSELRGLGEQVDSLTLATNSTSMDLRKLRMKINSEVQAEVSELKERLDKVQRSCWTLEEQLEGGKSTGREGRITGQVASKEMVNQLLDEMGVFDSARDMDGVTVELKLLQTKVDILEESQKGLKLRLRTHRDRSGSLELSEQGETDDGVEKLFEEIRKLKTSLAVTNTELQAGFKRTDNRLDRSENYISEMQQAIELVKYPNDSRVIRLEQQLEEMSSSRQLAPAVSYEHQVEALRRELGSTVSQETGELRKELGESQEHNRDSIDVIQQKCNSLYSECSSLNRKMEQINRQMSDKLSTAGTGSGQELLLHLEQGVKELQDSYDSQLDQAKRGSEQLSVSVDSLTRDMEQMQSGLMSLEKEAKRVWGEEGVMQRLEGIEEFLQRDLPSMGLTTSQKATLEKLIEERSDSVKAVLTEEIAEQVVEMRKMIPDIKGQQGVDIASQGREVEEKMDRFKRQVRELDQNAAKIFQSLTADMQKLAPKVDTSQQERMSSLEQEVVSLRDTLNRRIKQDTVPKLPPRQPDSLTISTELTQVLPSPGTDIPIRPAVPSRAHFSNMPPVPMPSDGYAVELLKRAGEKCPVSGERLMRVSRVHKTILEQATVLSDPFLSTQDGYQLRLQVCLLPSQSGVRVKVVLEILPSEHDEFLQWPVEGSVRYYVLNQIHDFAHIHLDDSFFFYRPARTPVSLKSSTLTVPNTEPTGPYCLNDCLYVRAQILNLSNVC